MKSGELVKLLKRCDPKGETTVRIEVVGLVGGIGNSYAHLPSVECAWRGIDWSSGELIIRPSVKLYAKKQ